MSTNAPSVPTPKPLLPNFPCPTCGANLLSEGFYNACTETQRLREDNFPLVANGKMYLDHDEDNFETIDHECDLEAYCGSCSHRLPWALYEIRGELDGIALSEADAAITKLISQLDEGNQPAAQA
jgi:hypothetical protein